MNVPTAKAQISGSVSGVEYATCTDIGLKRSINQDAYEFRLGAKGDWSSNGHLFIVADGMGAHVAGEYASRLAVDEVKQAEGPDDHKTRLVDAFHRANSVIFEQGQANPQFYNMGTTCSALWLLPSGALLGHIGDSRIYRQRGDVIEQLTFDHSLVWEMRAAGQITATNQAVPRNVITRCLGPHPVADVDLEGPFSVRENDTFLLCSDGLTGRISDVELGVAISHLSVVDAAEFLVDLANLRGGHDNITVTIVRAVSSEVCANGGAEEKKVAPTGTNPLLWLMAGLGLVVALAAIPIPSVSVGASGIALFLVAALALLLQWLDAKEKAPTGILTSPPYARESLTLDQSLVARFRETFESALEKHQAEAVGENLVSEIRREIELMDDLRDPNQAFQRIRTVGRRLRALDAE